MARKHTKVCRFLGVELPIEEFYKDKSQKDGRSPWSKQGEAAYNKAYHAALKAQGVTRVRDLDDAGRVKFDAAMTRAKVRIARRGKVASTTTPRAKARTNRRSAIKASNSA